MGTIEKLKRHTLADSELLDDEIDSETELDVNVIETRSRQKRGTIANNFNDSKPVIEIYGNRKKKK